MGWHSFDLKSSQLAVVGKVWGVPSVQTFLGAGGSVWECLADGAGIDISRKPTLKRALYAVLFGCAKPQIGRIMGAGGLDSGAAERFLAVPIIKDLWAARDERIQSIRSAEGICDAFGTYVPLAGKAPYGDNVRTLLAHEAQSFELALLEDALAYCRARSKVHLVSFLHDGFALKIEDGAKAESVAGQLRRRVAARAQALGISTILE
jgi:hypothetical protein